MKNLNSIGNIICNLKFVKPVRNRKLEQIRLINLSISSLYSDEDYNLLFTELVNTNECLYKGVKDKDRKLLSDFKKSFDRLPIFYKYRLSKIETDGNGNVHFKDKNFDNVIFITENYLNAKYNFKAIKYEKIDIRNENRRILDQNTTRMKSKAFILILDN